MSGPPRELCPKCNKAVYANEAKLGAGKKWHSTCFRCTTCNKSLDSTTVAEHDGIIFCKGCHGKQFGPKGYGFGGGAAGLSTDTGKGGSEVTNKPNDPQIKGERVEGGCQRCGKRVYEAEKKIGAGKDWHKSCFNCATCKKSLDSSTLADKDGEIYCKACYGKNFGPKGVGFGQGAGSLSTA